MTVLIAPLSREMQPVQHVPTGTTIRIARERDAASFYHSCYSERDWSRFHNRFLSSLRRQASGYLLYMVADNGSEVVAGGKLVTYGRKLEIADLMVAPAYRNRGLGTYLIQLMLEIADRLGFTEIEIGVLQNNHRALDLYWQLGFRHVREMSLPGREPAYILAYRGVPDQHPNGRKPGGDQAAAPYSP